MREEGLRAGLARNLLGRAERSSPRKRERTLQTGTLAGRTTVSDGPGVAVSLGMRSHENTTSTPVPIQRSEEIDASDLSPGSPKPALLPRGNIM